MSVEKIGVQRFLELANNYPVSDVRSPAEFNQAHIPAAYNLPLFTDEERKVVGTAYKKQSRQAAIKIGLDYFGVKMRKMVEEVERTMAKTTMADGRWPIAEEARTTMAVGRWPMAGEGPMREDLTEIHRPAEDQSTANGHRPSAIDHHSSPIVHEPGSSDHTVLVHCWRGGMRSAAVAWLLDLYGFKVYTLSGGYKNFRRYVLDTFTQSFQFKLLGGFTGSGKTFVLRELAKHGQIVVDLEGLANHKGSAFGSLGQPPQPSQEMFENSLALELRRKAASYALNHQDLSHCGSIMNSIWIEDESQRIGSLMIPTEMWKQMRRSPIYFLNIPFEARLNHIEEGYGNLEKDKIVEAILRTQKRLGGMETKTAIQFLMENNIKECFAVLLKYYDKCYLKGLQTRDNPGDDIIKLVCEKVDEKANCQKLMRIVEGTNQHIAVKNSYLQ